jgi:hypothetical protein
VSEKFEIPGFPGYEIDKLGNVYSSKKGSLLKFHQERRGYRRVCVLKRKGNKSRSVLVHRLMAITFLGNPPTPLHQVRHLNGDPTCNNIENLAWGTAKENAADRIRHGRKTGKPSRFGVGEREEMRNLLQLGVALKIIASKFQISTSYCRKLIRQTDRHNISYGQN